MADGRPQPTPLARLIAAHQAKSGLSQREAAEKAGISEARWRQLMKGYRSAGGTRIHTNTDPATWARMAHVAGVPTEEVASTAGPDITRHLVALVEDRNRQLADTRDQLTAVVNNPHVSKPTQRRARRLLAEIDSVLEAADDEIHEHRRQVG